VKTLLRFPNQRWLLVALFVLLLPVGACYGVGAWAYAHRDQFWFETTYYLL
jgi:hypothetical protein